MAGETSNFVDSLVNMFQSSPPTSDVLELNVYLLFIKSITGEMPQTVSYPKYTQIVLSPSQQLKMRNYFDGLIGGKPGKIRMDTNGVFLPILLKRGWPFLLAAVALGYIIKR